MYILYFAVLFVNVMFSYSQFSTMTVDVVQRRRTDNLTLVCNVTSSENLTRWTFLPESNETALMSYQNGSCTVSPLDSFLEYDSRYSYYRRYTYTCNSTVYQVIIVPESYINNRILACRDAVEPDGTGSTWMIQTVQDEYECSHCKSTITFDVMEVNEGGNVTFTCRVSSNVLYVNWNRNIGSYITGIGVQNGTCTSSTGTSFLDNTSEYSYTCNKTVYQVTKLNVQRKEHNDMYMCTPAVQVGGTKSNWIIKIKAAVTLVTLTPANYRVDIEENTSIELTCTTSTARPAATVYWYLQSSVNSNTSTRITENITTYTDYNELVVITSVLRFVPKRIHNDTKLFCTAKNYVNKSPVQSYMKRLLNVLYKAGYPYIPEGNAYRVIEHTLAALSCSVKGGNPAPTLSWSCNNFSPTNQSTIISNGNITTIVTWTALRNQDGKCICTSQQNGDQNKSIDVSLAVVYKAVVLSFVINELTNEVVTVNEGTAVTFKCVTDGNPIPTMSLRHGINVLQSNTSHQLEYTLSSVSCQDIGTYSCAAQNELNLYINVTSTDIIVYCKPRSSGTSAREILSGIDKQAEIACEVIAYPLPSFTWWRQVNDQWKLIQNTEHVSITSSGLRTILTIDKVDADDFTSYKVIVENSVGNMEQVYSLNDGSPDTPTQLRYFEELSTSSSVKVAWNAGYNGGSPQIFYIKYKTTDESSWKYKTVNDDGEQTQIYTLTGLEDKMYYYVIIVASNEYGNSTESPLLIANTKEMEEIQTSNIGPMVGGIVGGSIVLAVVLTGVGYIIGRYMERKRQFKKSSSSDKFEREDNPNVSPSDIQFDNIDRENEYEMIKQGNSPSMPYSTLQPDNNLTQDDSSRDDTYENSN